MAAADNDKKTGFDAWAVVLSALAAVVLLYALSLFLQGGFLAAQAADREAKLLAGENEALAANAAEQKAILDEAPRLLDETTGRYVMPVEDAKARLVEQADHEDAQTAH